MTGSPVLVVYSPSCPTEGTEQVWTVINRAPLSGTKGEAPAKNLASDAEAGLQVKGWICVRCGRTGLKQVPSAGRLGRLLRPNP